jgi:uncharacterized protein (TIGR03067 family)
MSLRSVLPIGFALFLLGVEQSPGADEAAAKAELKKLEGTWTATAGELEGKPTDRFNGGKLTIKADDFTVHHDDKLVFKATVMVYPDKKPKAVDLKITEGGEKGKTALGIYKLEGDEVKFCLAEPGTNSRPKDFTTKKGTKLMIIVLKREKK